MQRIASFEVDHRYIVPGIYISRIDGDITTYDMRTRKPNCDDFMNNSAMHTFEHLFATYIRNSDIGSQVIYFGPMGCATGFYLLVRNSNDQKTLNAVKSVLGQIINHKGQVFGNSEIECGNYKTLDLSEGVKEAKAYLEVLNSFENINFEYPKE